MDLPLDGEIASHISSLSRTLTSEGLCNHHVCPRNVPPPVVTAERAVLIRGQDGIAGGGYGALWDGWVSILSRDQRLRQMAEVAVTLSGVCLCAFWTTLLYHLL